MLGTSWLRGSESRPRRCLGRFKTWGTVKSVDDLLLETDARRIAISLHSASRIDGFARAGHPFLQVGDRITVHGRMCADPYAGGRSRLADHIAPAP
jgi:hypothetical protein